MAVIVVQITVRNVNWKWNQCSFGLQIDYCFGFSFGFHFHTICESDPNPWPQMGDNEGQEPDVSVRRRRTGLVDNSGLNDTPMTSTSSTSSTSSTGGQQALPYKTCNEYVQHLNVWILQTMQYNWFAHNYPLIMSSVASMQSTPSSTPNHFNFLANNMNQTFVNNMATNGPQNGQSFDPLSDPLHAFCVTSCVDVNHFQMALVLPSLDPHLITDPFIRASIYPSLDILFNAWNVCYLCLL